MKSKKTKRNETVRNTLIPFLFAVTVFIIVVFLLVLQQNTKDTISNSKTSAYSNQYFVKAVGKNLQYNNSTILLRGVNINNIDALCARWGQAARTFGNCDITRIYVNNSDYQRASSIGANHIRFGMSYYWYKKNRTQFFNTLDQHISYARTNNLWLVLTLFTLPGSADQNRTPTDGDCYEGYNQTCPFWTNDTYKQQFITFWKDVADHYKDEPVIAGFALLNEPNPASSLGRVGYHNFIQQTVNEIRTVNSNHLVFYPSLSDMRYVHWDGTDLLIQGQNIVYEVHDYNPMEMTHSSSGTTLVYPGPITHSDGETVLYNRNAFNGAGDTRANLRRELSIDWATAKNVPLYVGEWGAKATLPTYLNLIQDKGDLYKNTFGINFALYEWRGDGSRMAIFPRASLTAIDPNFLSLAQTLFSNSYRPVFPTPTPTRSTTNTPVPASPTPTPPRTPTPSMALQFGMPCIPNGTGSNSCNVCPVAGRYIYDTSSTSGYSTTNYRCSPLASTCEASTNSTTCTASKDCGWDGNRCYRKLQPGESCMVSPDSRFRCLFCASGGIKIEDSSSWTGFRCSAPNQPVCAGLSQTSCNQQSSICGWDSGLNRCYRKMQHGEPCQVSPVSAARCLYCKSGGVKISDSTSWSGYRCSPSDVCDNKTQSQCTALGSTCRWSSQDARCYRPLLVGEACMDGSSSKYRCLYCSNPGIKISNASSWSNYTCN